MTNVLLFKDLHEYLTNLGFIPDPESISRFSDDSNLMDDSEWPSATTVDLYGEDMLLYLFKDEIAVSISFSMEQLHCSVRSFTFYDYDDSEDGELDEFYFKSMSEFIDTLKNDLYSDCYGCDKNKFMEETAEYFQEDSDGLNRMSKSYDIIEELYKKVSAQNTEAPKQKEESMTNEEKKEKFVGIIDGIISELDFSDENDKHFMGILERVRTFVEGIYTDSPTEATDEDPETEGTPEEPEQDDTIKAEPLEGYPLKEYTIDISEDCNNHIRKQAERLNRIVGIDVDESIDCIQQNITKVFIGVLHQTLQARDQNESMDIDKFYTDNLYGDRFYVGKVEDGKVYSDLNSPVQCSDTVIAREILDMVHKNM